MNAPNFDCTSPRADETSHELNDSAVLLEDGAVARGSELQDDDGMLNSSQSHAFSSDAVEAQVHISPHNFESAAPLNNIKSPAAGLVSNRFISAEQMQTRKPLIAGAGLENLGNTCFLNSVLQCFMHTVPLLDGILSNAHSACSSCNGEWFCLLCSLRQLSELSFSSTNSIVLPWDLVNNLSYFSSSFQRFQQEDAHEFLQSFLDRLESCYESKQKEFMSSPSENLVKQVFGGRLVSKLKCHSCGHCSNTQEPSIDVSLEIEDADNLVTALQSFTKVEKLEDPEIKFTCENCKLQVSVDKQLSFDQAPSVAAFHLKRFKNDGCVVQKIDKHVDFPLELDLLPFMDSGEKKDMKLKYALYAAVVHSGLTATSGHYYCFIRVSPGVWCKYDDSKVVMVHEEFVLSHSAYILFYAKEGTSWFTDYIEASKFGLDTNLKNISPKSVLECPSSVSPPQVELISDSRGARDDAPPEDTEIDKIEVKCSGLNEVESSRSQEESYRMPVSVATPSACEPSTVSSAEEQKQVFPSLNKNAHQRLDTSTVRSSQNVAQIAARSPSPEIYREDPPDAGFSIPRDHLKLVNRMSCKRRLEKDIDDMETRQACSFVKKSIPGSRQQQLLSAIKGSRSGSSINRKIARIR